MQAQPTEGAGKLPPTPPKPTAVSPGEELSGWDSEEGLSKDFTVDKVIQPDDSGKTRLDRLIKSLKDRQDKLEVAELMLEEGRTIEDFFRQTVIYERDKDGKKITAKKKIGRIKKFADAFVSEELESIPKKYITNNEKAITIDEALNEINNSGLGFSFANEYDLIEYLKNWEEQSKKLRNEIKQLKPKLEEHYDTTLLKQSIKDISSGHKQGLKTSRKLNNLIRKLTRLKTAQLPQEYADQLDQELLSIGIKTKNTNISLASKTKLREFVDNLIENGDMPFVSEEDLAAADMIGLHNLTVDLLEQKYEVLKDIAFAGYKAKKLIATKQEQDLEEVIRSIVGEKKKKEKPEAGLTKSGREQKSMFNKMMDNFFSSLRKVEFIAETYDGFKQGNLYKAVIQRMQDAKDLYLERTDFYINQFRKMLETSGVYKNYTKFATEKIRVDFNDKVKILTKEEMLGIYVNSLNEDNKKRLTKGWGLTEEQIQQAVSMLSAEEKLLGDQMGELLNTMRKDLGEIHFKLTGRKMTFVEGFYFPIVSDTELDVNKQIKQGQRDAFQSVINRSSVEKGMTKERKGGSAPVDLEVISVFMDHLNKVNHFLSRALAVRDVQKIINHPDFKEAITDRFSEGVYNQFQTWVNTIANPRFGKTTGAVLNGLERLPKTLRHNATSATLGMKVSVSLVQAGSATQTANEIGLPAFMSGSSEFFAHSPEIKEYIYKLSPQMRFRRQTMDREISQYLEDKKSVDLFKGKKQRDFLFAMIQNVDEATTLPSWWASYKKEFNRTKDVNISRQYADGVVRRTQPQGMSEDLANVMKGSEWLKLFTMFYSHFSNYHNQMVRSIDKLKVGKDLPKGIIDFLVSFLWLTVFPSLYASFVKSGGKAGPEDYLTEAISYGGASIPFARDIVNYSVNRYSSDITTPAFAGLKYTSQAAASFIDGNVAKGSENTFKAVGYYKGFPALQIWTTAHGVYDLIDGRTDNPLRLILSPYQLKEK
jgi:hypothetical protein